MTSPGDGFGWKMHPQLKPNGRVRGLELPLVDVWWRAGGGENQEWHLIVRIHKRDIIPAPYFSVYQVGLGR